MERRNSGSVAVAADSGVALVDTAQLRFLELAVGAPALGHMLAIVGRSLRRELDRLTIAIVASDVQAMDSAAKTLAGLCVNLGLAGLAEAANRLAAQVPVRGGPVTPGITALAAQVVAIGRDTLDALPVAAVTAPAPDACVQTG